MSDEAVWVDVEKAFVQIGELRTAVAGVQSPPMIATPEALEASATESLRAVAQLVGSFPDFARSEATLLANAEWMGVMDAYRADNACINWYGTGDD
jgi:hypothetical protein